MEVDHAPPHRPLNARRQQPDRASRYVYDRLIGAGTYGKVYRARDAQENRIVALKEIRLDADELGMPSTALREISLLRELDHANIIKCEICLICMIDRLLCATVALASVSFRTTCCALTLACWSRLYDIIHTDTRLTLVFEYAEKDLKDYMTSHTHLLLREPFISKVLPANLVSMFMSQRHVRPELTQVHSRSQGIALLSVLVSLCTGISVSMTAVPCSSLSGSCCMDWTTSTEEGASGTLSYTSACHYIRVL
jgi:serine/threonine protein kinase